VDPPRPKPGAVCDHNVCRRQEAFTGQPDESRTRQSATDLD
jgi:hypothetical protein